MVFFTCGGCGTNIKKPQVEKHIYQCRNAGLLSCMDCNKDFRGDEYKAHTKCISELEKYSEVGFKQAANANKGEKKQESWVEIIRATLDANIKTLNPPSRNLLHALAKHDNVPRKKAKFLNFIRNISKYSDQATVENVWNLLETQWNLHKPPPPAPKPSTNGKADANAGNTTDSGSTPVPKPEESEEQANGVAADTASLSKREKKAERRKKQHKEEKKDKNADDQVEENGAMNGESEKKKRKRKREADADEDVITANGEEAEFPVAAEEPQKKKKKKNKGAQENGVEAEAEAEANDSIVPAAPPGKFNWETIITDILLKKSDKELSLKRLQKKVFAEYYAVVGDSKGNKSVEDLSKIMNKKIKKNPLFVVAKDNVKLVLQ